MKYHSRFHFLNELIVLPLTREWIEMSVGTQNSKAAKAFSLLRGSGLKYPGGDYQSEKYKVLPLTREWIEIAQRATHD